MVEETVDAAGAEADGSRVQVVARVRPVLAHENAQDVAVTVSENGTAVQVLLPDRGALKEQLPSNASHPGAKAYQFDACLPGSTTQAELAEVCGIQELVSAALDGYCVTIFAFGQTGSGKTHSMIGERLSRLASAPGHQQHQARSVSAQVEQEDGLLPRCLDAAYAGIEARSDQAVFTVTASCLELYNEAVTDLLGQDKARPLQVRKEEGGGFKVDGLTQVPCTTGQAAVKAMAGALAHRHTRAHALNDYSSRSHCLMTFQFASKEKVKDGEAQGAKGGLRKYGKLVLVDLAGSERLKESGTSGREAVRETGAINRSLFTLGQVLAALAVRSGREGWDARTATPVHVPYRDSKLTQLLWEGLKGSGRALMLACLAPMRAHAEETMNTLHFASMALRIKARPVILLDPQDQLVVDLRTTIKELREENRTLAAAMSALSSGTDPASVLGMLPDRLRLAAARDRLPSAPAPSTSPGAGASSPLLLKGPLGSGSPVRRRGGAGGAGRGAVGLSQPWQSDSGGAGGRSMAAEVLRLSHQHHPLATGGSPGAALATSLGAAYTGGTPPRSSPHQRPAPRGSPGGVYNGIVSPSASPGTVMAARRAPRLGPAALPGPPGVGAGGGGHGHTRAAPGSPNSFPELAALEAQFRDQLAGGKGFTGGGDDSRPRDQDQGSPPPAAPPEPEVVPEPKALHWAERNTWFGSDEEMTAHAYEVHDELIASGMDAASDEYYDSIEARVSSKFPDKWAAWQAEMEEKRRREEEERAARAAAKAAAAKRHVYRPAPGHNFGAALRVNLKESTPAVPPAVAGGAPGSSAGPFAPQRHYANANGNAGSDTGVNLLVQQPQASSSEVMAGAGAGAGAAPVSRRPLPAWGAGPGLVQSPKAAAAAAHSIQPGRRVIANMNRHSNSDPVHTHGGVQGQGSTSSLCDPGSGVGAPTRSSRPSPSRTRTSAASRLMSSTEGVTYTQGSKRQQQLQPSHAPGPGPDQGQAVGSSPGQPPPHSSPVILTPPSTKSPAPWQGGGSPAGGAGHALLSGAGWQPGVDAAGGWRELQVEYFRQRQAVLLELQSAKAEAEAERQRILAKIGSTLANSRWRA